MRMLLLATAALSAALGAGAAYADNTNVPSNSPYAVMNQGGSHARIYANPGYGYANPGYGYDQRQMEPMDEGRAAYDESGPRYMDGGPGYGGPGYHNYGGGAGFGYGAAPPPGSMWDQPSTIGGYPNGY